MGQILTPTYFRPGTLLKDDGVVSSEPFDDGKEEWILVDGTPASCVQIGLYHEFKDRGPVDLVLSGPNFGRNTTAVFALSSGTIGGALEGAVCGKKAIALSYAFDSREHDAEILAAAAKLSTNTSVPIFSARLPYPTVARASARLIRPGNSPSALPGGLSENSARKCRS